MSNSAKRPEQLTEEHINSIDYDIVKGGNLFNAYQRVMDIVLCLIAL